MKIIEMLDKMATGEISTQAKVKYGNVRREHASWESLDFYIYRELGKRCEIEFIDFLNDEIEIIEEDKEFEYIREIRGEVERDKTLSHDENQDSIVKNFNMLIKWVNLLVRNQKRIINEINKLKGEK